MTCLTCKVLTFAPLSVLWCVTLTIFSFWDVILLCNLPKTIIAVCLKFHTLFHNTIDMNCANVYENTFINVRDIKLES